MTEITRLENEIDSTNQILERSELTLDSKSSELKICMAQVEVLESTNQTLSQNIQDQNSKIENLKNDLESEKNLTKQKKSYGFKKKNFDLKFQKFLTAKCHSETLSLLTFSKGLVRRVFLSGIWL